MEGRGGGGEAQRVADQKNNNLFLNCPTGRSSVSTDCAPDLQALQATGRQRQHPPS
jgi:hypothetical protein